MNTEERLKVNLELVLPGDGRRFLNHWDFNHGNDTCCEIIDGKLMLMEYDENANALPSKEITLLHFLEIVESKF